MKTKLFLLVILSLCLCMSSCNKVKNAGDILVSMKYDETRQGPDGTQFVRKGEYWGVISAAGRELIPIELDSAGSRTNEKFVALGLENRLAAYWPQTGAQTEFKYNEIFESKYHWVFAKWQVYFGSYDIYSPSGKYMCSTPEILNVDYIDDKFMVINIPNISTTAYIINMEQEKVIAEKGDDMWWCNLFDRYYFATAQWVVNQDGVLLLPQIYYSYKKGVFYESADGTDMEFNADNMFDLEVEKGLIDERDYVDPD